MDRLTDKWRFVIPKPPLVLLFSSCSFLKPDGSSRGSHANVWRAAAHHENIAAFSLQPLYHCTMPSVHGLALPGTRHEQHTSE